MLAQQSLPCPLPLNNTAGNRKQVGVREQSYLSPILPSHKHTTVTYREEHQHHGKGRGSKPQVPVPPQGRHHHQC